MPSPAAGDFEDEEAEFYAFLESEWEDEFDRFQSFAIEDASDIEKSIDESASLFPYAYGYELLGRAIREGGLSGRTEIFVGPPDSARDGMAGYDPFASGGFTPVDEPNEVIAEPVPDSELAVDDRSGAWYLYATLLRGGFDDRDAWARALEWRGDRLGIFETGSEVVAVWRLRLADDAAFVADAIAQTPRDVFWSTVVEGNEAYVIAAESDAALATWEAQPVEMVAAFVDSVPNARKSVTLRLPEGCVAPRARLR